MNNDNIKKSRFPISIFWIFLGICFVVSGIHTGIEVLLSVYDISPILRVHIILLFWILIAIGLTMYVKKKTESVYEIPIKKISNATKRVARGDFKIEIPTTHPPDKYDYLDVMITDINKMIAELGSIETLKTDFVSNVSHEMKTPIAIIKSYAQLIQIDKNADDEIKEYALTIDNASDNLTELITNILKLNKLENQKIIPEPKPYDICRQISDCIINFESRWEEKNIELEVETEDRAAVNADCELMEIVWNNILSNAVKFSDVGGKITIKQYSDREFVYVEIVDNGCGMSEETLKHIFDKFYQGDTAHSKEGNGLGMALAYKVIRLVGGEISVTSKINKGSKFTVKLQKN